METHEPTEGNEEVIVEEELTPAAMLENAIRDALFQVSNCDLSLTELKETVHTTCKAFFEHNAIEAPGDIDELARQYYFCINIKKPKFENEVQEELYLPENLQLSREGKKALIRKKCVDICTNIYRLEKDYAYFFAMPFMKFLEKDPDLFDKLWALLFEISENAEDKDKVVKIFEELIGLLPEGQSYVWILVHSIVRGDYEVLKSMIDNDPLYFLHLPGDSIQRNLNKDRIASTTAIKQFMGDELVQPPIPGLRKQDFIDFDEREEEIFRNAFGLFKQDIDTLLYCSTPHEKILEHINWAIDLLKKEIQELEDVTDFDKQKYRMFVDQMIMSRYFGELLKFAEEMSKPEHHNDFAKDILNEPFLVRNRLIHEDGTPASQLEYLKKRWEDLIEKLKNPKKEENNEHKPQKKEDDLGKTMAFDLSSLRGHKSVALGDTQPAQALEALEDTDVQGTIEEEKIAPSPPKPVKTGTLLFIQAIDDEKEEDDDLGGFLHPTFTGQVEPKLIAAASRDKVDELIAAEIGTFKPKEDPKEKIDNDQSDSDLAIGFIAPGSKLEQEKMREIQQTVNDAFANRLRLYDPMELERLKELLNSLKPLAGSESLRKQIVTAVIYEIKLLQRKIEEQDDDLQYHDLYSYIRELFSELVPDSASEELTIIPNASEIAKILERLPRLDDHQDFAKMLVAKGLLDEADENERELRRLLLIEIQELRLLLKLNDRVKSASPSIDGLTSYQDELKKKLNKIQKLRKKAQGGRLKQLFRNSEKNKLMDQYFDKLDEFVESLWEEAIKPTINNFRIAYFFN